MSVSVWAQAYALLGAGLIGVAAGAFYDLLRALRRRVRGPIRCAMLDLLFWLTSTAALFLWSVRAGQGVVQLSACIALFLGAALYFRTLSPLVLPVFAAILSVLGRIFSILTAPIRLLGRGAAKIENFFKKHFSKGQK